MGKLTTTKIFHKLDYISPFTTLTLIHTQTYARWHCPLDPAETSRASEMDRDVSQVKIYGPVQVFGQVYTPHQFSPQRSGMVPLWLLRPKKTCAERKSPCMR